MASDLFPDREPPRGGLYRLRERLDREGEGRRSPAAFVLAPALLAVVLVVAWSVAQRQPQAPVAFANAARFARGELLHEPVIGLQGSALQRLPSPPGVLLYRVAGAPAGPPAPRL